jgi:chorismate mutase/prephenate dehydratase
MDIRDLRKALNETDQALTSLYQKRLAITEQVALSKIESGKAVLDQERELQVLAQAAERADSLQDKKSVRALYKHIMNVSRNRQYELIAEKSGEDFGFEKATIKKEGARIVYQGVEGAYS